MAVTRPVCVDIWNDPKFHDKFSPTDKIVFLYLLTNSHLRQLGIYKMSLGLIAYETNLSIKKIEESINRLEREFDVIRYSRKTSEIAILNYNKYSVLKGGAPTEKCYQNIGKDVEDKELLLRVYEKIVMVDDKRDIFKYILAKFRETIKIGDTEKEPPNTKIDDDSNKIDEAKEDELTNEYEIILLADEHRFVRIRKEYLDQIKYYTEEGYDYNGDWKCYKVSV